MIMPKIYDETIRIREWGPLLSISPGRDPNRPFIEV
jgi:hypothetical protein